MLPVRGIKLNKPWSCGIVYQLIKDWIF